MPQLTVTANKLNKRKLIPAVLPDPNNIAGVVFRGHSFEADEVTEATNPELGKWYRDRDGYYYWGGGVEERSAATAAFVDTAIDTNIPAWIRSLKLPIRLVKKEPRIEAPTFSASAA